MLLQTPATVAGKGGFASLNSKYESLLLRDSFYFIGLQFSFEASMVNVFYFNWPSLLHPGLSRLPRRLGFKHKTHFLYDLSSLVGNAGTT